MRERVSKTKPLVLIDLVAISALVFRQERIHIVCRDVWKKFK